MLSCTSLFLKSKNLYFSLSSSDVSVDLSISKGSSDFEYPRTSILSANSSTSPVGILLL